MVLHYVVEAGGCVITDGIWLQFCRKRRSINMRQIECRPLVSLFMTGHCKMINENTYGYGRYRLGKANMPDLTHVQATFS